MKTFIKTYFVNLKKAAAILMSAFVLIISSVIILNTLHLSDQGEMTSPEKIFRHFIQDHNANKNAFGFKNINFTPVKNYFEEKTSPEISVVAATVMFLISSIIIFYNQIKKKLIYAEKFLIVTGLESSVFRPPRFLS